jgi:hypothetical protein
MFIYPVVSLSTQYSLLSFKPYPLSPGTESAQSQDFLLSFKTPSAISLRLSDSVLELITPSPRT